MPNNVTALIDSKGHPDASSFYHKYPLEPTLPEPELLIIGPIVTIADFNLLTVIEEMKKAKTDNILICCHGTPTNLDMPIFPGNSAKLSGEWAGLIRTYIESTLNDEQFSSFFTDGEPPLMELHKLWNGMKEVRKKKLNRLELRACNIGKDADALNEFKSLFGCKTVIAPKVPDAYGKVNFRPFSPKTSSRWRDFDKEHRSRIDGGSAGNHYSLAGQKLSSTQWRAHAIAESEAAVGTFQQDTIAAGSVPADPVLLHAFFDTKLIFPRFSEYRLNLVKR